MLLLAVAVVLAAGCGGAKDKEPGQQADTLAGGGDPGGDPVLAGYRKALGALAGLETSALDALTTNTGAKYTDDAALLAALRVTALPKYQAYVDGLGKIVPGAEDLRAFHARLVTLSRAELALLERLATAVADGDGTAVLASNAEQRRLRDELERLVGEFEAAHRETRR